MSKADKDFFIADNAANDRASIDIEALSQPIADKKISEMSEEDIKNLTENMAQWAEVIIREYLKTKQPKA